MRHRIAMHGRDHRLWGSDPTPLEIPWALVDGHQFTCPSDGSEHVVDMDPGLGYVLSVNDSGDRVFELKQSSGGSPYYGLAPKMSGLYAIFGNAMLSRADAFTAATVRASMNINGFQGAVTLFGAFVGSILNTGNTSTTIDGNPQVWELNRLIWLNLGEETSYEPWTLVFEQESGGDATCYPAIAMIRLSSVVSGSFG